MKVLKQGNPKPKTTKKTCRECKSLLEYEPKDITSDRDGSYIVCPVCKSFLAV